MKKCSNRRGGGSASPSFATWCSSLKSRGQLAITSEMAYRGVRKSLGGMLGRGAIRRTINHRENSPRGVKWSYCPIIVRWVRKKPLSEILFPMVIVILDHRMRGSFSDIHPVCNNAAFVAIYIYPMSSVKFLDTNFSIVFNAYNLENLSIWFRNLIKT